MRRPEQPRSQSDPIPLIWRAPVCFSGRRERIRKRWGSVRRQKRSGGEVTGLRGVSRENKNPTLDVGKHRTLSHSLLVVSLVASPALNVSCFCTTTVLRRPSHCTNNIFYLVLWPAFVARAQRLSKVRLKTKRLGEQTSLHSPRAATSSAKRMASSTGRGREKRRAGIVLRTESTIHLYALSKPSSSSTSQ